eukprot:CAMPEP_0172457520 /NCGR_PEP_ID=MMETSP1065-20121228/22667_1 /TAXON_ID=265537 /ORGANISM="Amphiprora paludosa, Strain CCMP125" /LENGTH=137 /DNA_ID=CAMNT_0013211311 /DNA_START=127 /DNA_END=540 /DNA_ORIENTATION=+
MIASEVPELTPAGGTPFAKMFSCCLPKAAPSRSSKSISFADDKPVVRELEMEMEEDEDMIKKTDEDYMDEIPNMDDPPKSSASNTYTSRNPGAAETADADWIMGFWKMILSMFFLQWIQDAQKRQRIKNAPESSTTA